MKEQSKKHKSCISLKYLFYDFVKITAAVPGLLWFRPKKVYENKKTFTMKGGRLLICNHITNFDPVYIMMSLWTRRHHFVATKELFNGKFLNWLFTHFLCIPIDKNNFTLSSFKEIIEHLKDEEVVTMFPEGHVNRDGDNSLQSFKSGMVLISYRSGKPIIPIYIKKRKHFYNRLKVAIGEPIDIKELFPDFTMKDVDKVTELIYERESKLRELI